MNRSCAALKRCIDFCIKFSSKIDEKSSPKARITISATRIDKISPPGTPFGAKDRFLVNFWRPARSQKMQKVAKAVKNFTTASLGSLPKFHREPFCAPGRLRLKKDARRSSKNEPQSRQERPKQGKHRSSKNGSQSRFWAQNLPRTCQEPAVR